MSVCQAGFPGGNRPGALQPRGSEGFRCQNCTEAIPESGRFAVILQKREKKEKKGLTKERGRGNLAKLSGRTGVCQAEKVENEKKSKKALDKRGKTW